nr:hypothetical protein [uncultured Sellimonas sp.]
MNKAETNKDSKQIRQIQLRSSNPYLEDTFRWAVEKQQQFVMTGKKGITNKDEGNPEGDHTGIHEYIPSYWAGYFDRTAFYSRDFVHQVIGAHMTGLDEENFSMFKVFAKGATKERKWYTPWAFNFDGTPHTIDFKYDDYFVREVPVQFELVEKAYRQYLWSGDSRYLYDEDLWNFYTKVMTEFIALHDTNGNGVAEGTGGGIFDGTCSYNERSGEPLLESGDSIGSQYQATLTYAAMLEKRGDDKAERWYEKAKELKKYFNDTWSVADSMESEYVRALGTTGERYSDFATENTWFMPLKMITEPGERNSKYIDFILESLGDGIGTTPLAPDNLESYTYIPDMLFLYNRNEEAWRWMKYITSVKDMPYERPSQGTNGDYPEISFTFVSQVVEGMLGMEPDAQGHFLATTPRLPKEVEEVDVEHVMIGETEIHLSYRGNTLAVLTNAQGEEILWEAGFYGSYKQVQVDGQVMEAKQKKINGETVSYISVKVVPGERKEIYTI